MSGRRVLPTMNFDQASAGLRRAVYLAECFGLVRIEVARGDGDPRDVVPAARAFAAELHRWQVLFAMSAAVGLHLDTLTPDEDTLKRARHAAQLTYILQNAADAARVHATELEEALAEGLRAALADAPED